MALQTDQPVWIDRLNQAVCRGTVTEITDEVKKLLEELATEERVQLPDRFQQSRDDGYARRLLHRCPESGYTVVVMTWGPGQRTPLHDHAGIWCVECVVQGELEVLQYDRVESHEDRFRFRESGQTRAAVGDAGALIPPYEYHVLRNALADRTSISVHVYGGEMDHCNSFSPCDDGWWQKSSHRLVYDT